MSSEGKAVSIAQLCRWFGVPRSTFYYRPPTTAPRVLALDPALVATIRTIIEAEPAAGLRMITARVRRASPVPINRKKVHRILKINGWQVRQRPRGQRPRVAGWTSRTTEPNVRWAIDTTHLFCGGDGWCHLTAIIDCCDRTIVGWRLSRSGIAHVAAAAFYHCLGRTACLPTLISKRRFSTSSCHERPDSRTTAECIRQPEDYRDMIGATDV